MWQTITNYRATQPVSDFGATNNPRKTLTLDKSVNRSLWIWFLKLVCFSRRHPDLNWGIKDLQSPVLPLDYIASFPGSLFNLVKKKRHLWAKTFTRKADKTYHNWVYYWVEALTSTFFRPTVPAASQFHMHLRLRRQTQCNLQNFERNFWIAKKKWKFIGIIFKRFSISNEISLLSSI